MRITLLCLLLVGLNCAAKDQRQPPPLPELPNYPSVTEINKESSGEVCFLSTTQVIISS